MATFIGSIVTEFCTIGVSAPANAELYIRSIKNTNCEIGTLLRDDISKNDISKNDINIKDIDIKNVVLQLQAYEDYKKTDLFKRY